MLNFLLKLGVAVIPKTSNFERLKENFESMFFEISLEDFEKIKLLNKNERTICPLKGEFWKKIPYFD